MDVAGLVVGAVAVFACSLVVEFAQGRYSTTRAVELSDVMANGLGVALGMIVVAFCYVAWSALAVLSGPSVRSRTT